MQDHRSIKQNDTENFSFLAADTNNILPSVLEQQKRPFGELPGDNHNKNMGNIPIFNQRNNETQLNNDCINRNPAYITQTLNQQIAECKGRNCKKTKRERNRISAKECRQRKKEYMLNLEKEVKFHFKKILTFFIE